MEATHAHTPHERQDDQDPSRMEYDTAVIVFGIFAICLVATAPMVWMLVWMRNANNPEPTRRQLQRQESLPTTTEQPAAQDKQREQPLLLARSKARAIASSLFGHAAAAGRSAASRAREAYLKLQGRLARLSPTSLRRRSATSKNNRNGNNTDSTYDLPIMRKPAWQRLAESYTSGTIGKSREVVVEESEEEEDRTDDGGVKAESMAVDGTDGSGSGGGGEVEVVVDTQEPKAVVPAVGWAV